MCWKLYCWDVVILNRWCYVCSIIIFKLPGSEVCMNNLRSSYLNEFCALNRVYEVWIKLILQNKLRCFGDNVEVYWTIHNDFLDISWSSRLPLRLTFIHFKYIFSLNNLKERLNNIDFLFLNYRYSTLLSTHTFMQ